MTDNLQRFMQVATDFCTLIDQAASEPFANFVEQSTSLLASLYDLALQLPDDIAEAVTDEPETQDHSLAHHLGTVFGAFNIYRIPVHIYVAQSNDDAVSYGSLGDDFADMYSALKYGLLAFETSPTEAIWHWRFSFQTHWATHASNALWALNRLQHQQHLTA